MFNWFHLFLCSLIVWSFTGRSQSRSQEADICIDAQAGSRDDSTNLLQATRIHVERVVGDDGFQPHVAALGDAVLKKVHLLSNTSFLAFLGTTDGVTSRVKEANWPLLLLIPTLVCTICVVGGVMWGVIDSRERRRRVLHGRSQEPRARFPPVKENTAYTDASLQPGSNSRSYPPASGNSATLSPVPDAASSAFPKAHSFLHSSAAPSTEFRQSQAASSSPEPPTGPSPFIAPVQASVPNELNFAKLPVQTSIVKIPGMPPPICPALVLPDCESRFTASLSEIRGAGRSQGVVNIAGGLSGNPLLQAHVRFNGSDRLLELTTPESGAVPHASIVYNRSSTSHGHSAHTTHLLDIRGARGLYYGLLDLRSDSPCLVTHEGQEIMTIDGDPSELRLWVTSTKGQQLASAVCRSDAYGGAQVAIHVSAGMDTVLALSCILAVLMFGE